MNTRPCPQCGTPLALQARFCGQCGATVPEDAPVPAPRAHASAAARTMLGMPATDLPLPQTPEIGTAPTDPMKMPAAMKTMVGVAVPGIAPTQQPAPTFELPPQTDAPAPGRVVDLRSKQSTMLGVAAPNVVPPGSRNDRPADAAPPRPIVPAPAPLSFEPLPEAPAVPAKKGIPAVAVVAVLFLVVASVGGLAAFFATRSAGQLKAQPELDDQGRETLRIGCTSCPNGTTVTLGASSATFQNNTAVLPLPAPLTIGENKLVVRVDRPAAARDEDITMHVPVAYRVRADLTTLTANPPVVTVRVEAAPGSTAVVDGKPVNLDPAGKGSYVVDVSAEATGPRDDVVAIERKIPFVVTPKGGSAENGQLVAKTSVVPLHLDAPGLLLYTDKPTAAIAGQTRPNATVTIDGQNAPVDAQGRFGVRSVLGTATEKVFEIVANAPPLAPRIVRAKVVHVTSLDLATKGLSAESPLAFDAFAGDPAAQAGQKAVVEGEVVEGRTASGYTVLLVDEKKACTKPSCLVRVVHGDEIKASRGAQVKAFGRVAGAVNHGGTPIPDVDASLLLVLKAGR